MTDMTPDGLPDTPGPEATPEQDAQVRALLALLREEPTPVPDDVARRLDAVLAQERRTGARPVTGVTGVTGGSDDASATVTVLPTTRSGARPSRRRARLLGAIAAAAVVVLGGVVVSGVLRGDGSSGSASLAGGSESSTATRITASGTAYTAPSLPAQASALVAATRSAAAPEAAGAAAPAPPSSAAVAACVRQLTQGDGSMAIAADTGSYGGRPALVVVIPTAGDPSTLDVWVVAPTCSATSADLIEFQRIPAP